MKFSVITPSYNQGRFIARTLASVALQAAPGLEIEHLVMDGGSSDETLAVLARHPVRWVSGPDDGQADAVNKGICASDGEVIAWLNSDDIYRPGAFARVAAFLEAHPEVDVVYGMADHIDVDDRLLSAYPTEDWDFERLQQTCFICQPALFFRRRVVEAQGLLDPALHYCMDYEYWLRLGRAGLRFAYLRHKLAGSRMYAENKTLGARIAVHAEINDMFSQRFGRVPERWLSNYAHAVVERDIDRQARPRWFRLKLAITILRASMRWNGRLPAALCVGLLQTAGLPLVRRSRHGG